MEDKIIIKSKRYDVKKLFKYALIVGVIFSLLIFFDSYSDIERCIKNYEPHSTELYGYHIRGSYNSGSEYALSKFLGFESGNFLDTIWFYLLVAACPLVLACIPYFLLKSYELVITDKRAYGFTAFGRRVDLPMDSITAVSFGLFKGITISTASGRISFLLIKNRDKMYEVINKLVLERQNKETKPETVVKQEIPQSNADELKKYKDLLDGGVITQEEFDQKKKQLLGL